MKTRLLLYLALFTSLACSLPAALQLLPDFLNGRARLPGFLDHPREYIDNHLQTTFHKPDDSSSDNMPGNQAKTHDYDPVSSPLKVADILDKTREVGIFASLARGIESVSERLNDKSKNTTVLAPLNSALQALPRKPWENPKDYEEFGQLEAYAGQDGENRAQKNLEKFVEAHVLPESPWDNEQTVLGGRKLSWTEGEDGKRFIQPGNIEVDSIATRVSNGEVWILKGVINYE
ncbi:hypothetical protein FQN54_003409 [Arachnomyces sp. PD_36]|nr:hypothetical protein FQN54_003409 [Arachnomyces sp. PD_36]